MSLQRRRIGLDLDLNGGDQATRLLSRLSGSRPYLVGELYESNASGWAEGSLFGIDREGYLLTAFRPDPGEAESERFRSSVMELAIIVETPLVVLGFRFGEAGDWETVPYAWPLSAGRRGRYVPPAQVKPGTRALLWATLVDARTGVIRAQRGVALEPEFTLALNAAIRAQVRTPFNGGSYVQAIAKLHADQPTGDELVRNAAHRTTSLQ
jgi:hypothetical protein